MLLFYLCVQACWMYAAVIVKGSSMLDVCCSPSEAFNRFGCMLQSSLSVQACMMYDAVLVMRSSVLDV